MLKSVVKKIWLNKKILRSVNNQTAQIMVTIEYVRDAMTSFNSYTIG